jgi:hypothetical protein
MWKGLDRRQESPSIGPEIIAEDEKVLGAVKVFSAAMDGGNAKCKRTARFCCHFQDRSGRDDYFSRPVYLIDDRCGR